MIASGSDDKTVRVWDANTGKLLRTLEGHGDTVQSVSFSYDSRMIASGSVGGTVKVWYTETGAELQSHNKIPPPHYLVAIRFMAQPFVEVSLGATKLGKPDVLIIKAEVGASISGLSTVSVESHGLFAVPVCYTSAKVVLVGESNVGKSCLALRLTKGDYEEQMTTHGMRTWKILSERLDPEAVAPSGEVREISLRDLGGQDEYRLVNQLFLPETTLALILFDPTRGKVAYDDVREWVRRLEVQTQHPPVRILHLSDLHFSESDNPAVRLQPLISDLTDEKEGLGYKRLDYLVISGDLTNKGTPQEYEQVHLFFKEMVKQFRLSAQRCIIVPGNHYLNWDVEVQIS
ncbi:MAG: hypothetical protein HW390_1530 [Candidatus Brocadiaceae bacterium]|nr:hypothetical protein [Candidatus Brocadiaceae bacterium]